MPESTFLERIVVATRTRLAERQAQRSIEQLHDEASQQRPPIDFAAALRQPDRVMRIIAEIKRSSPSKGIIREDFDLASIAQHYVHGGAAAISVLTEQDFFRGSLAELRAVRALPSTQTTAILRKDFITDPYQIVEARAAGADTYLLIVALLDDATLGQFIAVGRALGMEPLVEVHDADEARRAVAVGAKIIGVNARDLRTFTVDTTLVERIRPLIPHDRVVIGESGITTMHDVLRMRRYGADAILVGETLMRGTPSIYGGGSIDSLMKIPPAILRLPQRATTIVKLCGMQTPADAVAAHAAGADMIGIVFVPNKRRQVSIETARAIVAALPPEAVTVGLFLAEHADQRDAIADTIAATGITMAQLHGAPVPSPFRDLPVPMIYPLAGRGDMDTHGDGVTNAGYAIIADGALPLLDSAPPGVWGGTGETGDWERARKMADQYPILLAGGLTPENVGDAIHAVRPWGVDVSSGIEGVDGQKDHARMRAFVQQVRAANQSAITA